VRLAALADDGARAEALVVAAECVSAHLGAPRAPARPRSLAAALWALPRRRAARALRLTVRAWRLAHRVCLGVRGVAVSLLDSRPSGHAGRAGVRPALPAWASWLCVCRCGLLSLALPRSRACTLSRAWQRPGA